MSFSDAAECVGGQDMDAEGCGQIGEAFLHAWQDVSVTGNGTVIIQDQMGEVQDSMTRDVESKHGFISSYSI
jgi:hypothetical protein